MEFSAHLFPLARKVVAGVLLAMMALQTGCASREPATYASRTYVQQAEAEATLGAAYPGQGVGSLTFVLDRWNVSHGAGEIAQALAGAALGANLEDHMMAFAESKGLWAYASFATIEDLAGRVERGMPVIVGLQDDWRKLNTRRPAVVTRIDLAQGVVRIREESGPEREAPVDEFLRKWRPVSFWTLRIGPADRMDPSPKLSEWAARARFFERRGESERALKDYESALAQWPEHPGLCFAAANLLEKMGDAARAENLYRRALAARAEDGAAATRLAELLASRPEKVDEAVEIARRAATLEPTNPRVLGALGYAYLKQGNFIAAAATLERARARSGDLPAEQRNGIALHLALAQYRGGQVEEARALVRAILREKPDCPVPADLRALADAAAASP